MLWFNVTFVTKKMILTILILGFLFGAILQFARLNKYNVISGLARLDDFTVAKAILIAIGVGAILINIEIGLGFAVYHVKPFIFGGIVLGGLIFGAGMAILGYCPGTMAISLGEGSLDAFVGIIGGLFGGLFFTVVKPSIGGILGISVGKISLNSIFGNTAFFYFLLFVIAFIFIWFAFWLNKREKNASNKNSKWIFSGVLLAILNVFVFAKFLSNRPIGASTSYPYVADILAGATKNHYFEKIQIPGHWEMIFLVGAFFAGLIISLIKKDFKITLIHSEWKKYKGVSNLKRIIWSFVGGFIIIFGARMAGGCTSGHILSGGMQMAVSSLVFAVFVFAGLIVTGKLFYKMKK